MVGSNRGARVDPCPVPRLNANGAALDWYVQKKKAENVAPPKSQLSSTTVPRSG